MARGGRSDVEELQREREQKHLRLGPLVHPSAMDVPPASKGPEHPLLVHPSASSLTHQESLPFPHAVDSILFSPRDNLHPKTLYLDTLGPLVEIGGCEGLAIKDIQLRGLNAFVPCPWTCSLSLKPTHLFGFTTGDDNCFYSSCTHFSSNESYRRSR